MKESRQQGGAERIPPLWRGPRLPWLRARADKQLSDLGLLWTKLTWRRCWQEPQQGLLTSPWERHWSWGPASLFLLGCAAPQSLLVQPTDMDTRLTPTCLFTGCSVGGQWFSKTCGGTLAWCEHKKQPSSLRAALKLRGTEQSMLHDVTLLQTDWSS